MERGPPLEALVSVLNRYTKDLPNNTLLEKWVDNALVGAIHTFLKLETPVRVLKSLYGCARWRAVL